MPKIVYTPRRFSPLSLATIRRANEILEEYEEQGYDLTLRQTYYQFVSRGLIANNDREYKKLGDVINAGRLAGLIDWDHIVDRTRFLRPVASWYSPASIVKGAADGYQRDLWVDQPYRVEVWVEKDALVGVIERACEDLRVPFLSCRGYTSQSEMWGASQRFYNHTLERVEKRVRVLHLGDHDPSGIDMSRDVEERILKFMAQDYFNVMADDVGRSNLSEASAEVLAGEAVEWAQDHFQLDRLALNWEQVQEYHPPPNPAKLTDSRGASYVEEYGDESWELDALEPTVIGDLIRGAVDGLRDEALWDAQSAQEEKERATLTVASDRWPEVAEWLRTGSDSHGDST